ncbi:MAG: hypothetical protein QM687_06295 [Ferruginibacter sp.]
MAIPEILLVLSSITVQDTLPKATQTTPAAVQQSATVALQDKKQSSTPPGKLKKKKDALLRKVSRGGWDRN